MKFPWVVFFSVVPACAEPRVPARSLPTSRVESRAIPAIEPSQESLSPLEVSWVPGQVSDTRAVLRARVEQGGRLAIPLTLRVTVPPGVRMVRGSASVALPSATQQAVVEYEYEFMYSSVPPDDIVVAVDGDTESMGVHGRAAYRFGRPEPEGPRPQPSGPPLVIGGRNFGSPVSATP